MEQPYHILAIDPGVKKSGTALYINGAFNQLQSLPLWELFDYIPLISSCANSVILIENSNLLKQNWHGAKARGGVGKNKAISQTIVDYCKAIECNYVELKPDGYSKTYTDGKGRFGKIQQQIFLKDTSWDGSSNEHERAACAMVKRYVRSH